MEHNDVSSFFYYMWNAWDKSECELVFKSQGWQHFWEKWRGICSRHSVYGATERFYAELSEDNRDRLVKRALQMYNRGKRLWETT